MENQTDLNDSELGPKKNSLEGVLWLVLVLLVLVLVFVLLQRNQEKIRLAFIRHQIGNFDELIVSEGFHKIQTDTGQTWVLSYEADRERYFSGTVRHTSIINESRFALLTHDILVTSGDFADPSLVETSVSNHHFTWMSKNDSIPSGTINLLHTVPMNHEIRQQLDSIQNGDKVLITGWDILSIEGYDQEGNYVGTWQDAGCNTTLVIEVKILEE